ncbi:MAG: tetratricopeptide repeat protein [Candidatus Eremiobacteraeota bacterium]|nr:tetratricopeptide repeat protein [Candidatus Eremiobacteraeota bacterium]
MISLFVHGCKKSESEWTYRERPSNEAASVDDHIDFLEERLKQRPTAFLEMAELAGYYLQRGKARRQPEDVESAQKWVDKSLDEQQNPAALLVRADALQMTHRFEASLSTLDEVAKLDPGNVKAVMLGVQVELARGDIEGAKRRLESLPDTQLSSYLFLRGQVAEAAGDAAKAREYYQNAIRREADSGSASESARMRTVLARLELGQGNLAEAKALLLAAHAIPVEQPLTEIVRARLMETEGQSSEAAALLRSAFEHYRDPLFLVRLGEVQIASGQQEEARKTFATAAQLLEGDPYGHERDLALALYYVDAKVNSTEIEALMKAEMERRDDPETRRIAEIVLGTR